MKADTEELCLFFYDNDNLQDAVPTTSRMSGTQLYMFRKSCSSTNDGHKKNKGNVHEALLTYMAPGIIYLP